MFVILRDRIINLDNITQIKVQRTKNGEVLMFDNIEIDVSKTKRETVREALEQLSDELFMMNRTSHKVEAIKI